MRLLHVDTGRSWRGGQAQVAFLLRGLCEAGYDPILAAPTGSPLAVAGAAAGIPVASCDGRGDLDVGAMMALVATIRRFGAGLVHAHTARAHALAVGAARLAGVPYRIVTRRVALPPAPTPWSAWKYRTGVTHYVAISGVVRDALIAAGVAPARISVVPSGVPVAGCPDAGDPAARKAAREALGLPAGGRWLGMVGALTGEKGHETALEALPRLPGDVGLVVLGAGPHRERMEQRARELGVADRVQWAGFRSDVAHLLPAFDLLVAPSRHEGLGTGVLEGMAAGLPVVASSVGEFPEMLRAGRCGRLVPPGDAPRLAEAVAVLLADEPARRELGAAARRRAADYAVERMIEGNIRVYESLIGDRRREVAADAAGAGSSPSGGSLSCLS